MRAPARLALTASIVAAGFLGMLSRPAAASGLHADWWTRDRTVTAPAGGMAVADDVDGVVAISAVRISIDEAIAGAQLIARPDHVDLGASIVACPVATDWSDAEGGDLRKAPAADCSRGSAPFKQDGDVWRADISGLVGVRAGRYGVALVPAPSPLAPIDIPVQVHPARFKASFQAPALEIKPAPVAAGASGPAPEPPGVAPPGASAPVGSNLPSPFPQPLDATLPATVVEPPGPSASTAAPAAASTPPLLRRRLLPADAASGLTAAGALGRVLVAAVGGLLAGLAHSRREDLARAWGGLRAAALPGRTRR